MKTPKPNQKPVLGLLTKVGETLYGAKWINPMATALGYSGRNVRFWLAGAFNAPEDLPQRLLALVGQEERDSAKTYQKLRGILSGVESGDD